MPLGSVEEWRARIGSSWCALGRSIKSDIGGRATQPMSGRVLLQMLYVLIMLALVVVIQRVRKVNKFVSGYHKEFSNIHSRITAKRLLFIMILLLQAQSFIQTSLLLRCGDIESNPGPGLYPDLDYDNIDDSSVLIEDDLRDVYREVVNIQTTYYQFGMELGLPPRELDTIRKAFDKDITQCFTEVLLVWLRQRYNVDKYGRPTWRRLVEAVDSPSGGNSHALAKTISSRHPSVYVAVNRLQTTSFVITRDSQQSFGPGDNPSGCNSILIQRCGDVMTAYYLRQVDERAWPPVKATNFINLALIKDQTSWRKTVQQSVDEIIGDKENTSYSDMLDDIDYSRFILLEGRPGCGKTTLMNKISRDWSKGEILKSKLVIFVPLRRLNDEPDRKLSTLIRVACPTLPHVDLEQLVSHIEMTQGQNVVFAFDGLDEYRPIYVRFMEINEEEHTHESEINTPQTLTDIINSQFKLVENEDIFDLLRAKKLPKALVILTSRPAASREFRQCAKKLFEVLGFLKEQVTEYIYHFFDNDKVKARQLISHLERHPNLMNMAYLPLHCAMLVFLYEEDVTLPETETEFYKHFTLSTLLRSLRKRNVLRENFSLSSFADLPHNDRRIFHMVCQLAFDATVKSYQVFKYSELKDKLFEVSEILSDESSLGLVVIDRYFMRCGHDETYTFLHLTFQEYLAAVHIARLNTDEQRLIIKRHGNAANLSVVWRFLCGMIDFCQPSVICIFASLMQKNEDLLFKVQCCYESQHSLTCTGVIRALHGELKFRSVSLSPSDCNAIGYIVKRSPDHVLVIFEKCDLSLESASSFFRHIGKHDISLTLRGKSANISCLEGLKQCPVPGLCCLNISLNNSFGDSQTQVLVGGLKHCTLLTKLDLSGNAIGSVGAQAIGEVLKHLKALENLDLGYNYSIGDSGAQALAEGLKYCTMLTNLNLGGNNIGNDGAVAVGESLQHCVCLEHLDLSINNIDSAGVQTLAENIKCCTKLKKLNFWGNELNHKAVPHLIVMITTFNSLQSLSIGEYHLNQNDKDELNKAAKTVTQGKLIIYS